MKLHVQAKVMESYSVSHKQYLRRKTGQAQRRPQLLELAAPAVVACGDSTPMTALASRLQELLFGQMITICGSWSGWPSASSGHVPALHRLRLHAPHLGQVQQVQWQLFRNIILYSCFPYGPPFLMALLFRA